MHILVTVGLSVVALYVVQRALELRRVIAGVDNFPGTRQILTPATPLRDVMRRMKEAPHPGLAEGFSKFKKYGWDAITLISIYPTASVIVEIADPAAVKEIMTHRSRFPKPLEWYGVLELFGSNLVTNEGAEWKRHRKVAQPAFTARNYRMVWNETARIMQEMLDGEWKRAPEIKIANGIDITVPITLYIIASAGFGQRISWSKEKIIPAGHKMSFKESVHIVSTSVHLRLLMPSWALGLTAGLRKLRDGFEEFDRYIFEMIESRRVGGSKDEKSDLLSNLIAAAEADSDAQLTDRELAGNIFIFLLAGHETTAHSICFCLAFLALYPSAQDKAYEEIKKIILDHDSQPEYESMGNLPYLMACFYETLRLLPPVLGIPKMSGEDQSLTVSNGQGQKRTMPLPKGTYITINTAALHRNPRVWEDPEEFKPERFLGDWPKDGYLPFSGGPRACIGRRFAETEAMVILSMLLFHYRVSVTDDPKFAHETFEQRKARILSSKPGITTTPVRAALTFTRRY